MNETKDSMKEKIVLLLLFFLFFSGSIMAQASISITKNGDMNFGTIAASSGGGTVVLSPSASRTASGGIILPSSFTGSFSAAQFAVTGEPGYSYVITLPDTFELTTASAGTDQTMTINTFNSATFNNSATDNTGVLTGGTDTVSVGATLNVGASQTAGSYTNAAGFEVTVNYN